MLVLWELLVLLSELLLIEELLLLDKLDRLMEEQLLELLDCSSIPKICSRSPDFGPGY